MSLSQVVEGVADLLEPKATEKGIALLARIDPKAPDHLVGDAVRLRQVLTNLVGNAVKFTESGQVFMEVGVDGVVGDTATLFFRVSDTGIGISEEQRERLFQPFEQADTSTVRRFGGTGLGLSICRSLIELMDGTIGVESRVGEGSTFHFSVPLEIARERRCVLDHALEGRMVRVVSANATLSRVLEEYLDFAGARVASSPDCRDVEERLDEGGGAEELFLVDGDLPAQEVRARACPALC